VTTLYNSLIGERDECVKVLYVWNKSSTGFSSDIFSEDLEI